MSGTKGGPSAPACDEEGRSTTARSAGASSDGGATCTPETFLSPEVLEHMHRHRPFKPQQLQLLQGQIEQYRKINITLREARKQHFVLRVISFNNERRMVALDKKRPRRTHGQRTKPRRASFNRNAAEGPDGAPPDERGSSADNPEAEEELERRLREEDEAAEEGRASAGCRQGDGAGSEDDGGGDDCDEDFL